jgi:hypothetical protein
MEATFRGSDDTGRGSDEAGAQPTTDHLDDAVGDWRDAFEIVRGDDDGDASLASLLDQIVNERSTLGIQTGVWLI